MILIIAGPRDYTNRAALFAALDTWYQETIPDVTALITGGATGVDMLALTWAYDQGIHDIQTYPAEWDRHGLSAGPIRNSQMAEIADAAVVVRVNKVWSKGTVDMYHQMQKRGKPTYIIELKL